MSLTQAIILFIVLAVSLVLLIVVGLMMLKQYMRNQKSKGSKNSGSFVPKEKFKEVVEKLKYENKQLKATIDKKDKDYKELLAKYLRVDEQYKKACLEISRLKQIIEDCKEKKKIRELTRDNDEPSKLVGEEPAPIVVETVAVPVPAIPKSESKEEPANNAETNSSQPPVQDDASPEMTQETNAPKADTKVEPSVKESRNEVPKEEQKNEVPKEEPKVEPAKERTMYASFPRSAGSNIYFSDLSENRVDDSYFELKVSVASGKATFKPLDFMKIRNYDPAMAAMLTEGVKPNIASTVIGIEPGKAHIEGKDWIIDNLAKIKLA